MLAVLGRRCGEVVIDGENGLIIDPLTQDGISDAIRWCVDHPDRLGAMSERAIVLCERFAPSGVIDRLIGSVEEAP